MGDNCHNMNKIHWLLKSKTNVINAKGLRYRLLNPKSTKFKLPISDDLYAAHYSNHTPNMHQKEVMKNKLPSEENHTYLHADTIITEFINR